MYNCSKILEDTMHFFIKIYEYDHNDSLFKIIIFIVLKLIKIACFFEVLKQKHIFSLYKLLKSVIILKLQRK